MYLKQYLKIFLINLFVLFAFGCSKFESNKVEYTVENYFPLNIGNKWMYAVVGTDSEYTGEIDTVSIDSSFDWDGYTVYVPNIPFPDYYGEYIVYYDREIRCYPSYPSDTLWYVVLLKEPFEIGVPFGPDSLEVKNMDFSCEVPAGKFENCIQIGETDESPDYYITFAPGVGVIKVIDQNEVKGVLLNYEIK